MDHLFDHCAVPPLIANVAVDHADTSLTMLGSANTHKIGVDMRKSQGIWRAGAMGAAALGIAFAAVAPAQASAHNCTGGGSNCIIVEGSGLKVTSIMANYSPAPKTVSGKIAKLRITLPGKPAKTHWENDSVRQGRSEDHNWNSYAKRYPNGTKICTGWKWTDGLACATVHD
ncbi:hypothetical protein [Streptomyces sp. KAU_LT]|uniref:hypothetical protein n=1 Tax=Streptomyces sp. KAU_LT TaxID=3046669 RepID=UPI0024B6873D|nr:hypothetical protein [Streptomyces sp. KAU_LT]MDI9831167.1 hypothetical protein [Streptomyces sp. KAU_LT]